MTFPTQLPELRTLAQKILATGIAAANPHTALTPFLKINTQQQLELMLNTGHVRQYPWHKIHLIAFGKAACAMTEACLQIIPKALLAAPPLIITNYDNVRSIDDAIVIGAGHPLPDEAGLHAAQQLIRQLDTAHTDDLVLVLISGGGSALLPLPVPSITLADKIVTTNYLVSSGATINEINCVRKHLSLLKGGGLTQYAYPADVHALILSDVIGDEISAIASGPTVPDCSTFAEALTILKNYRLVDKVPNSVHDYLSQGIVGKVSETPKITDPIFKHSSYTLIGSNTMSVLAMQAKAQQLGLPAHIYQHQLCGDVREEAEKWVRFAQTCTSPVALIAGGETTVTLTGNGQGGRNQEFALAFALAAEHYQLEGAWVFLSAGTDGRDGPTNAAGGLVDVNTLTRIRAMQQNPDTLLQNNDSYTALTYSNDLLLMGATGTNVADLQLMLIHPN